MKINVYTLNAFTDSINGGNPAGIVLDADGLTDEQMLLVAGKAGFSETAFFTKSGKADYKARFFTPAAEVDLCGHATIAAFYLLAEKKIISPGKYSQETKAGILDVEVMKDNTVFMEQTLPEFLDIADKNEIAGSLNVSTSVFIDDLPARIVSTGLKDIIVPVKGIDDLMRIAPDMRRIKEVSRKYGVTGYHLFTFETQHGSTAHCRNFAPLYDIDEEAATGTANGALGCYLAKYGRIGNKEPGDLVFEQGYSMSSPSEIRARIEMSYGDIARVMVGGSASNIQMIEMDI